MQETLKNGGRQKGRRGEEVRRREKTGGEREFHKKKGEEE